MKKAILVILIVIMMGTTVSASGEYVGTDNPRIVNDYSVGLLVNGTIDFVMGGFLLDSSYYVPLRNLTDATGYEIEWLDETQSIIVKHRTGDIKLTVGSKTVVTPNGTHEMSLEPILINGRTLFPVRQVAELMGFEVGWISAKEANLMGMLPYKNYITLDGVTGDYLPRAKTRGGLISREDLDEFQEYLRDPEHRVFGEYHDEFYTLGKDTNKYSSTKLGYEYEVYVENKGYMDLGDNRPIEDGGKLYLPIENTASLLDIIYEWDSEKEELIIFNYGLNPIVASHYSFSSPYTVNEGYQHLSFHRYRVKIIFNPGRDKYTAVSERGWQIGVALARKNGIYGYSHLPVKLNDAVSELDGKMILKNGVPYLEARLTGRQHQSCFVDTQKKVIYYGSNEFLVPKINAFVGQ